MSGDSDWMVDRRGWYAERERAHAEGGPPVDDAFEALGYEAAYPSPLPAPASDRSAKEET